MITLRVKNNQRQDNITKMKPQMTYLVDDAMADGVKHGSLLQVIGTGTAKGKAEATFTYAGASDNTYTLENGDTVAVAKGGADGIQFTASPKDQYGRSDDMEDETMLFPSGVRDHRPIGMIKEGIITLSDTEVAATDFKYFFTADETLTTPDSETANVGSGTTDLVFTGKDVTKEYRPGNKLEIDSTEVFVVSSTFDGSDSTVVVNAELDGAASAVTGKCQIGDPIWLADDMTGDLPVTTIKPTEAGKVLQPAGYIETAIHLRIKLGEAEVIA